jgi:radical SAM protein with 4Fe4S-binding SPASM domain
VGHQARKGDNVQVKIEANSNFHHLSGEDIYGRKDEHFREYRKKWKEWPETFFKGDFPLFIDIEATSACNLKCPFCASTFRDEKIKKGMISFDIVKKIIDEGSANGLCGVKFNIRGEPLLHPKIHEFVRYAKDKGLVDVYFNTNGMFLTNDVAERLIDAGLDRLSVSFEGYTKSVYEKYRVGALYETVLANIENIRSLKKKAGIGYPKVRIQSVVVPEMESDLKNYIRFWSDRADEVALLDYKEMKDKRKGIEYPWACPQIWQRMAVWWDGTVLPCNHDDDGYLALGNVKDTTIRDAWNSASLNKVRQAHKEGLAHNIEACDGCYLRGSEILKLQAKPTDGKI